MKRLYQIIQVITFRAKKDMCSLRASALTFTMALSIVPFLAVMFGIAKGFGIEKVLEQTIRTEFCDQEELIKYLINFSYSLLEHTRGGLIAGIGVITLFYTVLKLLSTIENSLNAMWGIKEGRKLTRKVIDFSALILMFPLFFVITSSLTVFVTGHLAVFNDVNFLTQFRPIILRTLSIAPYFISTIFFAFLYMYMPNTKVKFSSGLIAGIATGIAYQFLQASYIFIQMQLNRTGVIYGSFAALPLFLVWMYISWNIFLIGAEILVIHQEKLWDPDIVAPFRMLNRYEKELAFLSISKLAVDAYLEGKSINIATISDTLNMPYRLTTELIEELIAGKILIPTKEGIVPAKSPESLRVFDVLFAIEGENELLKGSRFPMVTQFEKITLDFRVLPVQSQYNVLLKDVKA